jgi:hypothetical protein
MTRDEIVALCERARDVGSVKLADFAEYIVVLESSQWSEYDGQPVERAYMRVDGKLAMANEDHRRQKKRLDFLEPKVLVDNPELLTLQVTVKSQVYGVRHGIATSRRKTGSTSERDFPWEVAETSAIGRALAAMGYGLLPGAGLTSAEDVLRASSRVARTEETDTSPSLDPEARFCVVHNATLVERENGWAHKVESGWCYGKKNGAGQGVGNAPNGDRAKPNVT